MVELWGKIICLGKSTLNPDSFEVMKVLVATKVFKKIEAAVLLLVGYGGYRIMVREVETISQMIRPAGGIPEHEASNNDIPGFEDIDDNISNHVDEDEADATRSPVQIFSKGATAKEPQGSYGSGHIDSIGTRTKTVSFSQNGYSEELLKVEHHLRTSGIKKVNERSR